MGKNNKKKNKVGNKSKEENPEETNSSLYPKVTLCTPTFNRRPFIPFMLKCFEQQTYPKDRIEWVIIDDGTDKIGDLVSHIPQVKYFAYNEKMTLGKKRNLMHEKSTGEILVYIDDDDYYPPERISHAVTTLQKNPHALCAGSSEMYIYFKHIHKMLQFGPYGPNHATAATFAFHRRLLDQTRYEETASLAEEKHFLKNYTIPFVQLDPLKSILVFSHNHNSFDKKTLLNQASNNPFIKETVKTVDDFVKETDIKQFFMEDIDQLLDQYQPGRPENKPDVAKQLEEMRVQREKVMEEQIKKQQQPSQVSPNYLNAMINYEKKNNELKLENDLLKDKVIYLEEKINKIIKEMIELKVLYNTKNNI